jgi:hypothetical protein
VLIDGGSSISLLYRSSIEKLGIPLAQLKPSRLTFHGIVPGHSWTPMGRVQLEVLFGKKGNSRREPTRFEVVDISSPYHALLGRPALAKFMVVPLRRFAEEKRKAIGEEIAQLLTARFIMEVFYPDWLANLVLVLKKNNTWRMCIDYTSLNKACPKDTFALPRINQVIDSTADCDLLSFLDAYSGYHQIPLY